MRLPQDRILHIGTELKDGKVNIVAEWQGELVRCKDCRFAEKGTDLSVEETDEGTPRHYIDWVKCHNYDIHKGSMRYVGDDDYCSWGERKGGDDK